MGMGMGMGMVGGSSHMQRKLKLCNIDLEYL